MRILKLLCLFLLAVLPLYAFAQSTPGIQPYQSYDGSNIDLVNLSSGYATIHIPLISYPQRGNLKLSFSIYLGTRIAAPQQICVVILGKNTCHTSWFFPVQGSYQLGGTIEVDQQVGEKLTPWYYSPCNGCSSVGGYYASWSDVAGGSHGGVVVSNGQRTADATGYYTPLPDNTGPSPTCVGDYCLTLDTNGVVQPGGAFTSTPTPPFMEDGDGNEITNNGTDFTDSVGRSIPVPPTQSNSTDTSGCTGPLPISSVDIWQPPGVNGGTETFKVCYATISINIPTVDNVTGTTTTVQLPQSIVLPNQTAWTFEYQSSDPSDPSGTNYGDLSQITLPNGGIISYTFARNSAGTCFGPNLCITSRNVNAVDGQGTHTWHYTWGSTLSSSNTYTNIVSDPLGNDTAHSFPTPESYLNPAPDSGYEVKTVDYQGSVSQNQVLKTVNTTYLTQGSGSSYGAFPQSVTVTLNNGQTREKVLSYATVSTSSGSIYVNKITDQQDYDYGSGAPGPLLRDIKTSYVFQSNSAYENEDLIGLIVSSSTYNGSGTLMAQTTNTYDESSYLTSSGVTTQHLSPPYSLRGDLTTVTQWLNGGSSPVSHINWYDTGEVYKKIDPLGHATTYGYSSTYAGSLPTTVTNALNQTTTYAYDFYTGKVASVTDPNNQTTTYTYNDPYGRLTNIVFPNVYPGTSVHGQTSYQYNDTASPVNVVETVAQTSTKNIQEQFDEDGLGREVMTELLTDPQGPDYTRTSFDADGRKYQVWNATRCNPMTNSSCSGESTWGITTDSYDALNRLLTQTQQDGSVMRWSYTGNEVTTTDETGRIWERKSDAMGRLIQVLEPDGSSTIGKTPSLETDYQYDALGNLLRVDQWGGPSGSSGDRVRTFTYDSLSRLNSATNPESGTIRYSYDADGDVLTKTSPLANQTGSATETTTYTHDQLNRVTSVNYSDGLTPNLGYSYDTPPSWAPGLQNVVGRLANSSNAYGGGTSGKGTATTYSYDAVGHVVQKWEQTPSVSPNGNFVDASYDLAGNLISTTTAAGTTISYGYNGANELTGVTSSLNDSQHPGTLYTAASYYPDGSIQKATFGNGLTETRAFNMRLQMCRMDLNSSGTTYSNCSAPTPSGNVLDFTYHYNATANDNGNIALWSETGQQTFARTFAYDNMNRILSMTDSASNQACKGLSWTIDAWGNMVDQTTTSGSCYQFSTSAATTNRLNSYTYDAAGNVTYDGSHHYIYDAEGRVLEVDSGSTASYVYNENGQRVRKNTGSTWTEYYYGPCGNVQSEYNGSSWPVQYVYAGGRLLAIYQNGTTDFVHADQLGSTRLITAVNQSIVDNMDYEPFGQRRDL